MLRGILKTWNDDKGYGFIRQDDNCRDVFIHISAFRGASRRPVVGDTILFQMVSEDPDRPKAVNAVIEGLPVAPDRAGQWTLGPAAPDRRSARPAPAAPPPRRTSPERGRPGRGHRGSRTRSVALMLTVAAAAGLYDHSRDRVPLGDPPRPVAVRSAETPNFRCEGKTRCSQMNSCEEAVFYLQNCPGTLTDGDADGIPCEDQWCGH